MAKHVKRRKTRHVGRDSYEHEPRASSPWTMGWPSAMHETVHHTRPNKQRCGVWCVDRCAMPTKKTLETWPRRNNAGNIQAHAHVCRLRWQAISSICFLPSFTYIACACPSSAMALDFALGMASHASKERRVVKRNSCSRRTHRHAFANSLSSRTILVACPRDPFPNVRKVGWLCTLLGAGPCEATTPSMALCGMLETTSCKVIGWQGSRGIAKPFSFTSNGGREVPSLQLIALL